MLTERFTQALAFASAAHARQTRKGSATPYMAHLLGVAAIALENGADEDQAMAALLHDCVEDQDVSVATIEEKFGPRVANIVADCTDNFGPQKAEWRPRKEAYLATLPGKSKDSLLVSLSDKTHNARAIIDDFAEVGAIVWDRFKGGKEGTLWYYRALTDQFDILLPGAPARRLGLAVTELERVATENA